MTTENKQSGQSAFKVEVSETYARWLTEKILTKAGQALEKSLVPLLLLGLAVLLRGNLNLLSTPQPPNIPQNQIPVVPTIPESLN